MSKSVEGSYINLTDDLETIKKNWRRHRPILARVRLCRPAGGGEFINFCGVVSRPRETGRI